MDISSGDLTLRRVKVFGLTISRELHCICCPIKNAVNQMLKSKRQNLEFGKVKSQRNEPTSILTHNQCFIIPKPQV